MASFIWGDGGAQLTPEAIAAQRKVAQAMMMKAGDYSPVQSAWQGAARLAEGLVGGWEAGRADVAASRNAAAEQALLASLIPGATATPAATAPAAAPTPAPASVPAGKEGFVSTMMPLAEAASAKTGIDPRIIVAQAALESGWGKSAPGNNYFGIKSHGQPGGNTLPTTEVVNGQPVRTSDSFRAYASPADSAAGYADFINANPRYAPVKAAQGMDAQIAALGQSGYATDPNYAAKIRSIAAGLPAPAAAPAATDPAALPANAQPAQGYAVPGQPTAPTGASPRLIAAMANPYISEGTKKVLGIMLTNQLQGDAVTQVDLGNKVGIMDKRGNILRTIDKGEPNKGPQFMETGEVDPQTGQPIKGWVDPRDKSVVPYRPQPATAQPSTVPPVPPGVDPKVWREAQSKRAAEEGMPASGDITSKLRNEIQGLPSYKNVAQAAPVYKSMLDAAGRDNRAADVNMIYGMAKIMDPGSVVRESEMSVAQAIATMPQQLQAAIKSQMTGDGRLTPELRAAIMQEARSRIMAYQGMFDQDATMYRGIAQRNRMNEADVLPTFGPFDEYKLPAPAAKQAPAAPQPGAIQGGYRFKGGNPADQKNWEPVT